MSKISDLIQRIKGLFNRNPRLEETFQKVEKNTSKNSSRRADFRNSMRKIYPEEKIMDEIMTQLGIDQELIKNKTAHSMIAEQIGKILEERNIQWPEKNTGVDQEKIQEMVKNIKDSGKEREEEVYASYGSRKIDGYTRAGLRIDEKGNVIFANVNIIPKDSRLLATDDEYMQTKISINKDGKMHEEGYVIKLDPKTSSLRDEKDATRDFIIDYDENGELIGRHTHRYAIQDGKKVIIGESHEEGEQLLTEHDIIVRDKILQDIDRNGQDGIDRALKQLSSLKAVQKEAIISKLLDRDFSYIRYDDTNNPDLYAKCLQQIKARVHRGEFGESVKQNNSFETFLQPVLDEIQNPKEVQPGKYKIPQKYLFESIRAGAEFYTKAHEENLRRNIAPGMDEFNKLAFATSRVCDNSNILSYLEMDGVLSQEEGKKFEEMYEDKSSYLLQQKYEKGTLSEGQQQECFKNGIKSLDKRELSKITTGTYDHNMSFQELIKNTQDKIVMRIPREAFDPNSEVPVWGADGRNGDSFILPEYVVGKYGPDGFKENPIPVDRRTQYSMEYKDGAVQPIENTQEMSI